MSVSIHDIAIIGSGNVANFIAHILSEKGLIKCHLEDNGINEPLIAAG
jgi:saccharopine dehydrogenase-like NADP-dependent oxidoreductase